jgi:predicted enzyme related to lactoylglutathione lyase
MNITVGYANIKVSDLGRAIDFYQGVLGLRLLFRADEFSYARFDAGPVYIGLAAVERSDQNFQQLVGRYTGIGFVVPDIDAAYRELSAKGVRFRWQPADQPWGGRPATFEDPDGNVFYLDKVETARLRRSTAKNAKGERRQPRVHRELQRQTTHAWARGARIFRRHGRRRCSAAARPSP